MRRSLIAVTIAIVVGISSSLVLNPLQERSSDEDYRLLIGQAIEGPYVVLRSPVSLLDAYEFEKDVNGDGIADSRSITVNEDTWNMLYLSFSDVAEGRDPVTFSTMIGERILYKRLDDDGDNTIDRVTFSIVSPETTMERFDYADFNADGWIDGVAKVQDGQVVSSEVLLDMTWVPVERWKDRREAIIRIGDTEEHFHVRMGEHGWEKFSHPSDIED